MVQPGDTDPGPGEPTDAPDEPQDGEPDEPDTAAPTTESGTPLPTRTPGPTPLPPPRLGSIMGVEITNANFGGQAGYATEAGAYWTRWNAVFWSEVEASEGNRDWTRLANLDAQLAAISDAGMNMILIVRRTPTWAQKVDGYFCGPIREDKLEAFADFMFELVQRYSGPPYNVKYWEMGNEPDIDPRLSPRDQIFGCWGDEKEELYGGEYYAKLLKAVYPRIKEADPEAQLLVGGLLLDCDPNNPPVKSDGSVKDCTPARFLEGILEGGGGDYFDGVSFHAYDLYYDFNGYYGNSNWDSGHSLNGLIPVIGKKAQYLRSLMAQYGYLDKYLINTETALLCGRDGYESFCQTDQFQQMKAAYVAQSYAAALAEGLLGNLWYNLGQGWRASGLTRPGQGPALAYDSFQFAAQQFENALFWGQVGGFDGVFGYKFRRESKETWLIWSLDTENHAITLPFQPDAIYDIYGQELAADPNLTIGVMPFYVEWTP